MNIVNKIGLEAEFFVLKKGVLAYPRKLGFQVDNFLLLGEMRAKPGKTREETIGFFFDELARNLLIAKKQKVEIIFPGYVEISPELKAETLRAMGTKEIAETKNIYRTDILHLSDDVIENGVLFHTNISNGLHIHFSKEVVHSYFDDKFKEHTDKKFILRNSEKISLIKKMDDNIFPKYAPPIQLKYRKPGYYEDKNWGFEYRSLPMIDAFTDIYQLTSLVDFCFTQLELLEK